MATTTRALSLADAVWGVKWLFSNQQPWSLLDRTPPIRTDGSKCSNQDQQQSSVRLEQEVRGKHHKSAKVP